MTEREATPRPWDARRLAASLAALATRVLPALPADRGAPACEAIGAFADAPSPARYLAAWRALIEAERRHKLALVGQSAGVRARERGLTALAHETELPPEILSRLEALPADLRTGQRLSAVAALFEAHRVLALRAQQALEELQQTLGPPVPTAPRAERRRRAPRRATR